MYISNPFATFTRPATTPTYASGQLVNSAAAGAAAVPMTFTLGNSFPTACFRLTRVRITKTGTTGTNGSFRLHLYESIPAQATGDTAVWATSKALDWIGNIDVASMLTFTDGCTGTGSAAAGSEIYLRGKTGSNLYGLLEARAAYVGQTGEVFTVILEELDGY